MKHLALLGIACGAAALAVAGCGDSLRDPGAMNSGPLGAAPIDDTILRGDVGDFVWFDANDNGLQDDGAMSGVNGVDVIIDVIRIDGSPWTMTFTTANDPATGLPGWYNFNAVPAGNATGYVDPATIPAGLMLGSHACGGPIQFVIGQGPVGNNNDTIDFCLVAVPAKPGAIGDFVWCDANDDGVQDPGEPGIPGIVVNLDCDGALASTVTDANGYYLFTGVPTGELCTVTLDPLSFPADKTPGTHCPTTRTVTLADGETNLLQDFCLIVIPPPPGGDEGCTPGYWKNHTGSWAPTGYTTGQALSTVFNMGNFPALASTSLHAALSFKGGPGASGGAQIMLRAAVAALLNTSHPGVSYPRSEADVILDVNAALATADRTTMLGLGTELDNDNNLGCPLN
ncbi:MAG: SdrD B-like domain-containing protein [Candidatus Eiseniibacteriota bacterium]